MDLEPGRQSSTGRAASEIRAAGGLEIYVCPQGYVPVDAQGNAIGSHTVSEFKCEQQ
jgi:hypothetical protein